MYLVLFAEADPRASRVIVTDIVITISPPQTTPRAFVPHPLPGSNSGRSSSRRSITKPAQAAHVGFFSQLAWLSKIARPPGLGPTEPYGAPLGMLALPWECFLTDRASHSSFPRSKRPRGGGRRVGVMIVLHMFACVETRDHHACMRSTSEREREYSECLQVLENGRKQHA